MLKSTALQATGLASCSVLITSRPFSFMEALITNYGKMELTKFIHTEVNGTFRLCMVH